MRLKRFSFFAAIWLLGISVLTASNAAAETLQVQFTGLNLQYDGANIFDAGVHNTVGSGNPAEADALSAMNFYLDGSLVGSLTSDIYADVYIKDVLNIPAAGGVIVTGGNGSTFGIDLLMKDLTPGWGLALDIDTLQFFYTGSRIAISVAGLATNLAAQDLPFDLQFDPVQPIRIVLSSASLSNVTTAGGFVTGFNAAGTGNASGEGFVVIPEPASYVLAGLGIAALAIVRRRRKAA